MKYINAIIIALLLSTEALAQDFGNTIQQVEPIPEMLGVSEVRQGRVETFRYKAVVNDKMITKHARVYLPYDYNKKDKRARYNVVYLMHGGGDNSTSFFSDPRSPLSLIQVLDYLIANKEMDPVIVVTPTFYVDDENIGANSMDNAIRMCRDFHIELQNHLIPAIEKNYNILSGREHRAFGGFSMGSLCTWYQLAYGSDAVRNFIPLSGDLWVYDNDGKKYEPKMAAEWLNAQLSNAKNGKDIRVFAYTGTKDIAGTPERNFIEALTKHAPIFRYNVPDANFHFSMKVGGVHYYGDINEYLFYALPLIWSHKNP